jgi:hypothetical protein
MKSKKLAFFAITILSFSTFLIISSSISLNTNYLLKTGDLRTSQGKIFDNLWANYTFDVSLAGDFGNTTFRWDRVSGDIYNVTWDVMGDVSTWLEDKQTRIIASSSGSWAFNALTHTPIWIFTNLTIGNSTWISVDGDGDFEFDVVGELNVTITDIGTYESWVLLEPILGSFAFYEKTTGLLMGGIFAFDGGLEDYELVLTATNMFSHYAADSEVIPGYDLFILIPIIAVMSLVILIRKRKKL